MNRTKYVFKDAEGKDQHIYVISSRAEAEGPRKAAGTGLETVAKELVSELNVVAAMAGSILEELKRLQTSKVEVEFGVELGGKAGIPFVTEGTANANFKVTLSWKRSEH